MNITLSISDEYTGIFDVGLLFDIICRGEINTTNVFIPIEDALEHSTDLERTIYVCDMLGVGSFYLLGDEKDEKCQKLSAMIMKSRFSDQKRFIVGSISEVTNEDNKELQDANSSKVISGNIRSVFYWNGSSTLEENGEIQIDLDKRRYDCQVIQIQKVILPDYSGSQFGINKLEQNELGTVLLRPDNDCEHYLFNDNTSKGFIIVKDRSNGKSIGFGITIS